MAISPYRALSWLCVIGVIGYLWWIAVVPFGFQGAPVVAVVILGLTLAALRLGVRNPVNYWEAAAEPDQVPRVALLIAVCLGVQLLAGAVLHFSGRLNGLPEGVLGLLVWVGVPAALIGSGFVRWPRRDAVPGKREFLAVAGVAIVLAAGLCLMIATQSEGQRTAPSASVMATEAGVLAVRATMEEVVFRVLLLTAIVQASRSRTQALILSSVVFALVHVPLALSQPLIAMDWGLLAYAVTVVLPEMVWQLGFGFVLGALWIRTGSITLIALTHTIINLGQVLVTGLPG
jgi:membrane protease YdiL (CAAX protease family)